MQATAQKGIIRAQETDSPASKFRNIWGGPRRPRIFHPYRNNSCYPTIPLPHKWQLKVTLKNNCNFLLALVNTVDFSGCMNSTIQDDIKEMIAVWEQIAETAMKQYPHLTRDELFKLQSSAMNHVLGIGK